MKRAPQLHRLSQDHHHGLVLARRMRRAGAGEAGPGGEPALAPDAAWSELVERFARELEPHFRIEEARLAPPLCKRGEGALVARMEEDHAALRRLVAPDAPRDTAALRAFGDLLERHIRFEERELFPVAEERLNAAELEAIAAATRATRR